MKGNFRTTSTEILENNITGTLFKLSIPTITAFAFQTTFNFVDRFFVSKVGEVQFAALGMAFVVQMMLIAIGVGLSVGSGSLVARHLGARQRKDADMAAANALFISFLIYIPIAFLGPFLAGPFYSLIGAKHAMLSNVTGYIDIILVGSIFQLFTMTGNGILRGEGNTVTPMRVMMTSTLINITLDPILIFGLGPIPGLGVRGAAYATIISRAIGSLVLAKSLFGKDNEVKPVFRGFRPELLYISGIWGVGGPVAVSNLANSLGLSIIYVLIEPYGDSARAAFTMGFTYQQLALLPVVGIASGVMTMIGQNFGARNMNRLRRILGRANLVSASGMVFVSLVFILLRRPLTSVFVRSTDSFSQGIILLPIIGAGFPFMAVRAMVASAFQGLGMGMKSLLLSLLQMMVLSLPLALLGNAVFGFAGIWSGLMSGHVLSSIVGVVWIKSIWRKLERDIDGKGAGKGTAADGYPVEPV